jgi:hypothetical protein
MSKVSQKMKYEQWNFEGMEKVLEVVKPVSDVSLQLQVQTCCCPWSVVKMGPSGGGGGGGSTSPSKEDPLLYNTYSTIISHCEAPLAYKHISLVGCWFLSCPRYSLTGAHATARQHQCRLVKVVTSINHLLVCC